MRAATARVTLSTSARADLKSIYRYTFNVFGEAQADCYTRDIHARFSVLADFPGMGLPARLGAVECLEFPIGSHVDYYRRTRDGVQIGRTYCLI